MLMIFWLKRNNLYFFKKKIKELEKKSICNRKKIGCIIINKNNKIISKGYNVNIIKFLKFSCEDKKKDTYFFVKHAEDIAMQNFSKEISINKKYKEILFIITYFPCFNCALKIINFKYKYNINIIKIIFFKKYNNDLSKYILKKYNIDFFKADIV
jgi:dCMP deaminase